LARLTVIGSGGGMPLPDRATSGYVLEVDGRLTLIECGGGVCSSFRRCGFDPLAVERVFISHSHSDHCCELSLFFQMQLLSGREGNLPLYLPEEFVEPFRNWLLAVNLFPGRYPSDVELIGYSDGFRFDDEFVLTAIGNRHLQGLAEWIEKLGLPNRMQCHSFVIEVDGKRLFYSSDVWDLDDVVPHIAGVDLAIVEAAHVEIEPLLEVVGAGGPQKLLLSHLGEAEEVEKIRRAIEKRGQDNVTIARDGIKLSL